ncbi:MAG TPA: FxsA family protein [Pseudomonadales bacterium]|nr:FxsA family protein [Pseudomonadales bacterium]
MFLWLILLAPVVELWFLIHVGGSIGALNTIVLLIGAGMLGSALLRQQSFTMLMRLDDRLQKGEMPAEEILEGALLTLAAVLLIIPGFISDMLAVPLLVAPLRRLLIRRYLASRHFRSHYTQQTTTIIEGEFHRENDKRLHK